MSHLHTNKLSQESSPYLLQHAHNPVDWHPWGEEALSKAREQDKPILVSIGYAACHWCHVMERESFEDEATAAIMNEHFINIKIDREERPDLDHIYMDAVQAISGSGGWPLNVFLTPAGKPFYGGTYFPPKRAFNRPSWNETLLGIIQSYKEKRHEIDAQAENLTDHILQSNSFGQQLSAEGEILNFKSVEEIASNILKQADKTWGGFGKAPKFPQTFSIQYLLRNDRTLGGEVEERGPGGEVTQVALLSLDKMIEGGIYDQVGGGFARYSTDTEWLVPHFEKMLYDNALLVSVLSEAYQLTRNERYREVIEETIAFIEREMLHPARGFYAALDADSEGEEGKFYVWRFDEVKELLGDDAAVFSSYYEISESGNLPSGEAGWIGKNILHVKKSKENFSRDNNISINELNKILGNGRKILLEARSKRVRPQLDDKIILGWNALMNTALSKAFAATGHESYRQLAIDNMRFILTQLEKENGNGFYHTWKNDEAKFPGFLDDHAFLIQALIHLQEITADTAWLLKARTVCEHVIDNFSEEGTSFFYYTPADQTDVIIRKKEVYDGAVPSGNSTMAYNLFHLSILFDEKGWHDRSLSMLSSLGKAITRYPSSFGNWASLLQEMLVGTNEIAILGDAYAKTQNEVLEQYIPHRVLMAGGMPDPAFPLLAGKQLFAEPVIYLCRNYTCASPVFSTSDLMLLINNPQNR